MATSRLQQLLREPLLQFAILALIIAGVDVVANIGRDSDRVIRVDEQVRSELVALFAEFQSREPSDAELDVLLERWLENEIMYREARLLRLDQGDEMFRERLILKLRNVIGSALYVPEPTEQELRVYFEAHSAEYDQPATYDFSQFLAAGPLDKGSADALAARLAVEEVPEEYADGLRRYRRRSRDNITDSFGPEIAEQLIASGGSRWEVIESPRGWHLARIEATHAPVSADFEKLRNVLRAAWAKAIEAERLDEAFDEIRARYTIIRTASS